MGELSFSSTCSTPRGREFIYHLCICWDSDKKLFRKSKWKERRTVMAGNALICIQRVYFSELFKENETIFLQCSWDYGGDCGSKEQWSQLHGYHDAENREPEKEGTTFLWEKNKKSWQQRLTLELYFKWYDANCSSGSLYK